jgi:hypothetical protein
VDRQFWLRAADPAPMLAHLLDGGLAGDRKLRLWCAACFDVSTYDYPATKDLVAFREGRTYDGEGPYDLHGLADCWVTGRYDNEGDPPIALRAALLRDVFGNPFAPVRLSRSGLTVAGVEAAQRAAVTGGCCERFADYKPCDCLALAGHVLPGWLTPTVLGLARAAWDAAEGQRLDPLTLLALADALEEAGANCEPLLRHLRGQEVCWVCRADPHTREYGYCIRCSRAGWVPKRAPCVRGCAILDLLLGEG